jgi:ankyrin repeat protein
MVRLLIDKGASVTGDLEGYTPTELAKKYGQEAAYQLLVSRGGIPVDSRSSAQLAFVEAAGNGDIDAMEGAATMGAKIDGLDANKQTALVAAVRTGIYERGRANAIWWLLDHGADPNQKGESGKLPLHMFVLANMYTLGESQKRAEVKALAEETLRRLIKAGAKARMISAAHRSTSRQSTTTCARLKSSSGKAPRSCRETGRARLRSTTRNRRR